MRGGKARVNDVLTPTEKVWRVGDEKRSLNAPTVFRNIQKMYLVSRESGTFQTRY